jgi:hypothetical protein
MSAEEVSNDAKGKRSGQTCHLWYRIEHSCNVKCILVLMIRELGIAGIANWMIEVEFVNLKMRKA